MVKKKKNRKWLGLLAVLLVLAALVGGTLIAQKIAGGVSRELSVEEAQKIVDETLAALPKSVATGAKLLAADTRVTVESVSYGDEKDVILECSYETKDVRTVVENGIDDYIGAAYELYLNNEEAGIKTNATKVKLLVAGAFEQDLAEANPLSGKLTMRLYETEENVFTLYLSDETVNTVFGGLLDAKAIIDGTDKVVYNGEEVSIANQNTLRSGIKDCMALNNYSSRKPDTSVGLMKAWNSFKYDFHRNFVVDNQWKYITNGLITTLQITALAVLIGIAIGFIVAVVGVTNQKTGKLGFFACICRIYVSIMRGVPLMVQLLIMYFVILLPIGVEKFPAAVLCFGLNSGAYVSEIVRGGIMSIDEGQTEAGRSLGFTYMQTMFYIVIPQAFKAVLPSLANEFITLLKESSVAFYIGVADLTLGGLKIRSITFSSYMPLIAVAIVYYILVSGLSKCVSILERRLRKGDNR